MKTLIISFFTLFFIFLLPVNSQTVTRFYVSPTGLDNNPGTETQPFRTIEKAKQTIRTINSSMMSDIIVYLRNGIYQLSSPLTFESTDSGNNGFNIIYQNYPNEVPMLTGGKVVTGWMIADQNKNIWKTNVGTDLDTRQLYVNGQRATRAKSNGGLPGASRTTTGFTTTDLSMQNWENITNVELVRQASYRHYRCGIQNITGGQITMQSTCWNLVKDYTGVLTFDNPDWVENAYELLDSPGEWYLNRVTGWLYYKPTATDNPDMNKNSVVFPFLTTLVQSLGTMTNPVHNLVFKNLVFSYTTWTLPNTSLGFPNIDSDLYLDANGQYAWAPATVSFDWSNKIQFVRNVFIHLGATALHIGSGAQDFTIAGNHITDISGAGIRVSPEVADANLITPQNKDVILANRINIYDNYIHTIGIEYRGGIGILLTGNNSPIYNNELFDLPYNGIQTGARETTNNTIHHNYIHGYQKYSTDGGGIHVNSVQHATTLFGNVLVDGGAPGGIYLDFESAGYSVYDNAIINTLYGMFFYPGVAGNTFNNNWHTGPINSTELNYFTNDHPISSISEVPNSIILAAGLETGYLDIKVLNIPTPPTCPLLGNGDLDCSGHVDIFDYNNLLTNFGKSGAAGFIPSDINHDGKVDIFDYNILIENFGK